MFSAGLGVLADDIEGVGILTEDVEGLWDLTEDGDGLGTSQRGLTGEWLGSF